MMTGSALRQQVRALWPGMLLVYTLVVIALGIVVAIRITTGIPLANLTRDPLQVLLAPVYIRIIPTIGGLIWAATAAVFF